MIYLIWLCSLFAPSTARSYIAYKLGMRWINAANDCVSKGMTLATVTNEDDVSAINTAKELAGLGDNDGIWIGLSDQITEGVWLWHDGTSCSKGPHCIAQYTDNTFPQWDNGQPDGRADCAILYYNGWVYDLACGYGRSHACETSLPTAMLAYEFENSAPLAESISGGTKYDLHASAAAETSDGKLILKTGGYVYTTADLDFSLESHSLEAYVKPSNLFSVGGGIAGISSPNAFESIVYNEHKNGLWFSGSEYFRRTKTLMTGANVEPESCTTWIHMVITYDVDNNLITMYRNGVQYGDAYSPSNPNPMLGTSTNPITPTGNWKYLIGPRGLGGLGHYANEFLGTVDFSRLYNVVLTDQQVSELYEKAQKSVPKVNVPQWENKSDNDIHIIISHQIMNVLIGLLSMVSVLLICCFYYGQRCNKMSKGYGKVKQFDTESEIEI